MTLAIKKRPAKKENIYQVDGIELGEGPSAFGVSSTSPEWIHECEVRHLASLDHKALAKFMAGIRQKRPEAAAERMEQDVEVRREAMMKTGIKHSRINMQVFMQVERARSGAHTVAAPDLFDDATKQTAALRRGPGM